jgi:hypothetical protein
LLARERQQRIERRLALLLALQRVGEAQGVDRHARHVDLAAELSQPGRLAGACRRRRVQTPPRHGLALDGFIEHLGRVHVARVERARGLTHGGLDERLVVRELLNQAQPLADREYRDEQVVAVGEAGQGQARPARDRTGVDTELIEDERDEVDVPRVRVAGVGRCRRGFPVFRSGRG